MKHFQTRGLGVLAAAAIAAFVPAAADAGSPHAVQPTAHASCSYGRVEGKRKCLQAGEYCRHTRRANRDYHRYGYSCGKRDRRGSYHLVHW
jgi:hypothetical protein